MELIVPEKKWTDERLDDLNTKVDAGFAKVDSDIRELRGEMNTRFEAVNGHFLALHRLLIRASIGAAVAVGVALIGLFAGFFAN